VVSQTLPERGCCPGCCTEAQEDPGEVVHPIRRGAAGTQCILEAAVVWLCWMLSMLHRAAYREEVNWVARSDVMTAGTPYLLTHP
jgi:hypothetical protein